MAINIRTFSLSGDNDDSIWSSERHTKTAMLTEQEAQRAEREGHPENAAIYRKMAAYHRRAAESAPSRAEFEIARSCGVTRAQFVHARRNGIGSHKMGDVVSGPRYDMRRPAPVLGGIPDSSSTRSSPFSDADDPLGLTAKTARVIFPKRRNRKKDEKN